MTCSAMRMKKKRKNNNKKKKEKKKKKKTPKSNSRDSVTEVIVSGYHLGVW